MRRKLVAPAALAAVAIAVPIGIGSSHREAPDITLDPSADNTDTYAWTAKDAPGALTVAANWIPNQVPANGPNFFGFDDRARYYIHVDNTGDGKPDVGVINEFGDTAQLFPGTGLGTFGPPARFVVGDFPTWGSAADFTERRNADLIRTLMHDPRHAPFAAAQLGFGLEYAHGFAVAAFTIAHPQPGSVDAIREQQRLRQLVTVACDLQFRSAYNALIDSVVYAILPCSGGSFRAAHRRLIQDIGGYTSSISAHPVVAAVGGAAEGFNELQRSRGEAVASNSNRPAPILAFIAQQPISPFQFRLPPPSL